MKQLKGRPTHKQCRQCKEWFELPAYAKPTHRFCSQSCAAKFRTSKPEFKKAQSERSKAYMQRNAQKMHDAVQALWADPERRAVLVEQARERSNTKKHLAWMKEHNKRIWSDPEFRKRHVERTKKIMKKRWSDPEELAKNAARMSRDSKKRWADPEKRRRMTLKIRINALNTLTRKKLREKGKARMSTPENKAKSSATMKALWRDPVTRARFSKEQGERMRKLWRDPKFLALKSAQSRAQAQTPEGRARFAEMIRKLRDNPVPWTPERRAAQAKINSKRWADPKWRERAIKKMKATKSTPEYKARVAESRKRSKASRSVSLTPPTPAS